ncbi:MAG: response regulator transcription factor [Treponema sp.]|jgi:DNA-binding NarL/FixJ family response regulator|nr:response regulator transcription factor [Treponema sp.]
MIDIVVFDCEREFLTKLCQALLFQSDFRVAGLGKDGYEAIAMTGKIQPNVVLLSLELPMINGLGVAPMIKRGAPSTEIIILTGAKVPLKKLSHASFKYISGYLTRASSFDLIYHAIRTVYHGGRLVAPEIAEQMDGFVLSPKISTDNDSEAVTLNGVSRTELRIVGCVGKGLTNREIADQLYLTEGTIRNYVSQVLQKTGLRDRTQLAIYAVKTGIG